MKGLWFMPCRLVGADITHPSLHRHVHASTGEGVLAALGAASQIWPPGSSWVQAFQRSGITAAERQALRTLLLQVTPNWICVDRRLRSPCPAACQGDKLLIGPAHAGNRVGAGQQARRTEEVAVPSIWQLRVRRLARQLRRRQVCLGPTNRAGGVKSLKTLFLSVPTAGF